MNKNNSLLKLVLIIALQSLLLGLVAESKGLTDFRLFLTSLADETFSAKKFKINNNEIVLDYRHTDIIISNRVSRKLKDLIINKGLEEDKWKSDLVIDWKYSTTKEEGSEELKGESQFIHVLEIFGYNNKIHYNKNIEFSKVWDTKVQFITNEVFDDRKILIFLTQIGVKYLGTEINETIKINSRDLEKVSTNQKLSGSAEESKLIRIVNKLLKKPAKTNTNKEIKPSK